MIRSIAPAALALFGLPACTSGPTPSETASSATPGALAHRTAAAQASATASGAATASPADSCGATQLRGWISAEPSDDIKAQIAHTIGNRPIRYYTDGDPVTMDFRPDRLNVVIGKSGRIAEFRCG